MKNEGYLFKQIVDSLDSPFFSQAMLENFVICGANAIRDELYKHSLFSPESPSLHYVILHSKKPELDLSDFVRQIEPLDDDTKQEIIYNSIKPVFQLEHPRGGSFHLFMESYRFIRPVLDCLGLHGQEESLSVLFRHDR